MLYDRYSRTLEGQVPDSTLDTTAAEAYDSVLVPVVLQSWAELMVREADVHEGMRTLDIACGTGVVARCAARAAGPSGHTSGIDIDPAMIEVAKSSAQRQRLDIDYRCTSAEQLPFESGTFDAVFCQQGLQYFPDKTKALREVGRVMRPGARFIAVVWTDMETCAGNWAMITALERRSIDAKDMRKPFSLSDRAAMGALVESAGFERVTVCAKHQMVHFASVKAFVEGIAQGAPSSRLALMKVPPLQWPDFLAEVESQLAPWINEGRLAFPMACNVLVAIRPAVA
jgi:SAM-dependent methyltransferase